MEVDASRGAGDGNARSATRIPVEDRFAEEGVYVPSLRARYSARLPQSSERLERKGNHVNRPRGVVAGEIEQWYFLARSCPVLHVSGLVESCSTRCSFK